MVINISLPTSWESLTQKQLRFLLSTMVKVQSQNFNRSFRSKDDYSIQSAAQVATLCLFEWSQLKFICLYGSGWLVSYGDKEFTLSAELLADAIKHLEWINTPPSSPVRLDKVDGALAVPADLSSDFSFDNWLACESLWQAYQSAPNNLLLQQMAEILYRKPNIKINDAEALGIFFWWAAVKSMVAQMFPHFFKPAAASVPLTTDSLRRSMDAQIRALTKGDISKEAVVLSLDAIRALTELDAQADEYEQLNKKYGSK